MVSMRNAADGDFRRLQKLQEVSGGSEGEFFLKVSELKVSELLCRRKPG